MSNEEWGIGDAGATGMPNVESWSFRRMLPSAHAEPRRSMSGATGQSRRRCLPSPPALSQACDSAGCLILVGWERGPKQRLKSEMGRVK